MRCCVRRKKSHHGTLYEHIYILYICFDSEAGEHPFGDFPLIDVKLWAEVHTMATSAFLVKWKR